jgi:hypothetical protein
MFGLTLIQMIFLAIRYFGNSFCEVPIFGIDGAHHDDR